MSTIIANIRRHWWFVALAASAGLLLIGLLTVARSPRSTPPEPLARTRRTLDRLAPDVRTARLVTSDDGSRQASVEKIPDGGCRVRLDGTPQAAYRQCGPAVFGFSRGAGRLIYDAVDADDRPWLVVDDVPVAIAEVRGDQVAWSRNGGRRWAATGRVATGGDGNAPAAIVAVDGEILGPWVDASRPVVSDDDTGVAVVVQHPDASLGLVVDGTERRRFPFQPLPCGMPAPPASQLDRHVQLRYLADGRLVQVAPDRDGWAVFRDDGRLATYPVHVPMSVSGSGSAAPPPECEREPAVLIGSVNVAERAPAAVWWERIGAAGSELRWRVSRDGAPASPVLCRWPTAASDAIAISPDGAHVGFACAVNGVGPTGEVYAVLDGRRFGPYRQVWGVTVSPDGSHIAYAAAAGGGATPWRIYRDGVPLSRSYWSIWPPRFSADGHHVAWEGLIDREGRGVAGVDGHLVAFFNGILSGPLFPAPDRAAWVILRGRRVIRVEVDLRAFRGSEIPATAR